MPKQFGTVPTRGKRPLSWKGFYGTHAGLLNGLLKDPHGSSVEGVTLQDVARPGGKAILRLPPRSPIGIAADRLNELGVGLALKAAELDNSPEAFKRILQVLFIYLGVRAPKGVFTPKVGKGNQAGRFPPKAEKSTRPGFQIVNLRCSERGSRGVRWRRVHQGKRYRSEKTARQM